MFSIAEEGIPKILYDTPDQNADIVISVNLSSPQRVTAKNSISIRATPRSSYDSKVNLPDIFYNPTNQ